MKCQLRKSRSNWVFLEKQSSEVLPAPGTVEEIQDLAGVKPVAGCQFPVLILKVGRYRVSWQVAKDGGSVLPVYSQPEEPNVFSL